MNLTPVLFSRKPMVAAGTMEQPPDLELKNTFGLWNASLDDAVRYGGEITRQAIKAMNLRHDRKNIIVDTKVHMLMPGWSPAIMGWHNDGSPRDNLNDPNGSGLPDIFVQESIERYNRYHILVSGTGCLTQYINQPITIFIPEKPSNDLYSIMSDDVQKRVKQQPSLVSSIPSCTVMEFDWWNVHTGIVATKKEWRYLIRVAESDYYEPQKDLRQVIRMQSQVYSPANFGW